MAEPNRASIRQRLKEGCEIERAVAYDQDVHWLLKCHDDLLAACEAARTELGRVYRDQDWCVSAEIDGMLENAIAKAKGQEPLQGELSQ